MLRVLRQILEVLLSIQEDVRTIKGDVSAIRTATEAIQAEIGAGPPIVSEVQWTVGTPEGET